MLFQSDVDRLDIYLKDKSSGVKKLIKDFAEDSFEYTSLEQLIYLQIQFNNYNPAAEAGQENKKAVLSLLNTTLLEKLKPAEITQNIVEKTQRVESFGEKIANQTVVLELHIHSPGFGKSMNTKLYTETRRQLEEINTQTQVEESDSKRYALFKNIIDKKYLKPLLRQKHKFVRELKTLAVPSSVLAGGHYLVPIGMIEQVDASVVTFQEKRDLLIQEFEAQYEVAKLEAKQDLKQDYDESDYAPFSELIQKYGVDAKWLSLNVPAAIERVNRDLFNKEREKVSLQWEDTYQEVKDALRQRFSELVTNFANVLGNDEAGKPKTFQESTLIKLKSFLNNFEARNLTNDEELSVLAQQARELLTNVDAPNLRKDSDLRANLLNSFKKFTDVAESLVIVQTRQLDFDEEND